MFVSFFPRPKLFFLSAIVWTALAMAFWYGFADDLMGSSAPGGDGPAVGVATFWSARALWFDSILPLAPQSSRAPGCGSRHIPGRHGPFSVPR